MLSKQFLLLFLLGLLIIPGGFARAIAFENPLDFDTVEELLESVINFIFYIALAITPLLIVIAAYYFLTAGGRPENIKTAKKIIMYAVIGLAIMLLTKGIIGVIKYVLGIT